MRALRSSVPFVLLLASSALPAEVKLDVRADGIKLIRNEPAAARSRRLSDRLVAPPTQELEDLVDRYAGARDLDPRLVRAVMQVESGYNAKALSNKGAIGLMQLMPDTARELAVDDPWDPEQNVRGGTTYLRRMLDTFHGDVELALAAYNAGPNAVLDNAGIPPYPDTRAYVRRVLCLFDGTCASSDELDGRKVEMRRAPDGSIVIVTTGTGG